LKPRAIKLSGHRSRGRAFMALLCMTLALGALAFISACDDSFPGVYNGYVEGDYIYISSPSGGKVVGLPVEKGDEVKAGDALYELDPEPELTEVREAESRHRAAKALYEDKTLGQRPTELAAIEASIAQAEASREYSEKEFNRINALHEQDSVSGERLDSARAAYDRDRATVAELRERLKTARMGSRTGQVDAARKEVEGARAALERARWTLEQKKGAAPSAGRVVDVLYRDGEYVPAGYPVVVLLPPERVKARFFVPEPELSGFRAGQRVSVSIDGREGPIEATISFISPKAEYAPPFIYSKDSRDKLVFMMEASFEPAVARGLNPGQPLEVRAAR
jgi:HlyD family secretion protein